MYFIKKVDSKNISIFRIHFYPKFGAMVCVNNIILLLLFYNKYFYYSLNLSLANSYLHIPYLGMIFLIRNYSPKSRFSNS